MDTLQREFLARVAPAVKHRAAAVSGQMGQARREELKADALGLAWVYYRRLISRGVRLGSYYRFAVYVVLETMAGKGQADADVLSPRAQRMHGLERASVEPDWLAHRSNGADELDAVVVKLDWDEFVASLPEREQRIAAQLLASAGDKKGGTSTTRCEVSQNVVYKIRAKWWKRHWKQYTE